MLLRDSPDRSSTYFLLQVLDRLEYLDTSTFCFCLEVLRVVEYFESGVEDISRFLSRYPRDGLRLGLPKVQVLRLVRRIVPVCV